MAGSHEGTTGPIVMRNPGLLMDVIVSKGATFTQEVSTLLLHQYHRVVAICKHAWMNASGPGSDDS